MSRIRKRKLTIEHHEVTSINLAESGTRMYCRVCGNDVVVYRPSEFFASRVDALRLSLILEGCGELHFAEGTIDQLPLICGGPPSQDIQISLIGEHNE